MEDLTPSQLARRERAEGLIALAAPLLDLVLATGERISRIAEPTDYAYYPIRPAEQGAQPEAETDRPPRAP